MNTRSPVTVLRIRPRTLGGVIFMIALGGESYLMSLHTSVASTAPDISPKPEMVLATPDVRAINGHPAATTQPAPANRTIPAPAEPIAKLQIPSAQPKSIEQHSVVSADLPVIAPTTGSADERAAVLKRVESLELQSIILSDAHHACIINGVTCEVGQQVDSFTVETITSNSVTVSLGIYRFDLAVAP
jgi:hypothetical protein